MRHDAPQTAIMEVRRAVRVALDALPERARRVPLVVGCSGGADSLALTLAAAAVRGAGEVQAAVVDHRLQDGSAERAAATVALLAERGITARVHAVDVTGPGGMEAAARRARQGALRAARPDPDSPILLGHTLDDQAESVLLGLGRGSGARSLAGMLGWDPPWLRPLLAIRRATTRAACAGLGLPVWDDPHNVDPRFTRVRLRHEVLPLLEEVLAGGVAKALARTAAQLREDADALDVVAARLLADALRPTHTVGGRHSLPAACAGPTGCAPPDDRQAAGATHAHDPSAGRPKDDGPGAEDASADQPDADRPHPDRPSVERPSAGGPSTAGVGAAGVGAAGVGAAGVGAAGVGAAGVGAGGAAHPELDVAALADVPPALRRRVLRAWLALADVTGLTDAHLRAADVLAARGPDRAGVAVPGGLELYRAHGRLGIRPVRWSSAR
jgi:tRNA(Ile)-lysidine synthase